MRGIPCEEEKIPMDYLGGAVVLIMSEIESRDQERMIIYSTNLVPISLIMPLMTLTMPHH